MSNYERYTYRYWRNHKHEQKVITEEHVGRAKQGKAVWNQWAKSFEQWINKNEEKAVAIIIAEYEIPIGVSFSGFNFPCNAKFTKSTFRGYADFSESTFSGYADFRESTFNGVAGFSKSTFSGNAGFSKSTFSGKAHFSESTFSGKADFSESTFSEDAGFNESRFCGYAHFSKSTFCGYADFSESTFSGYADFSESTFSGKAHFSESTFSGDAGFSKSTFSGYADFRESTFSGDAYFSKSTFSGYADFTTSSFEKSISFKQARFVNVPEFNFSSFQQPPFLGDVKIPFLESGNEVEKYRKLKQMAIESKDHDNELKFFGYETHAKAYSENKTWYEKGFIKLYWLLSDFGSSIGRPIASLGVYLMILFAANYFLIQPDSKLCVADTKRFVSSTLTYTLSEALPIFRLGKEQTVNIKKCLFGEKPLDIRHNSWRIVHFVPSTFLLFLFGLGVRNRFKIK